MHGGTIAHRDSGHGSAAIMGTIVRSGVVHGTLEPFYLDHKVKYPSHAHEVLRYSPSNVGLQK